jgi:peptidoglycan/LPS O-acetylase OafA/YrhL
LANYLSAYPFASASSAAFYVLLIAMAVPVTRPLLVRLFAHRIPPHQQYLRGFDSLRGIAAAMVAIGHCWWATYPIFATTQLAFPWLAYTTKWVSIFAVLSGFLIYRSGLQAIKSVPALREYLMRRFFRIYPVYLLGTVMCLILGQYTGNPKATSISYFFSDLFMLPVFNWPSGFANPPTWSLYVEVLFYAVLPLALCVVGQRRMVPFCLVSIAVLLLADNQSRVFALWKYFLFGIIASELSPTLSRRAAVACATIGLGLLLIDFKGPAFDWAAQIGLGLKHDDEQTIGLGLGYSLLLAGLPHLAFLGRILSVAPLQMIGIVSFSVYVTQFFYIYANFPEIGLFTLTGSQPMYQHFLQMPSYPVWYLPLVFFPGALFWGVVSYLLVERPGMMLGRTLVKYSRSMSIRQPLEVQNESL